MNEVSIMPTFGREPPLQRRGVARLHHLAALRIRSVGGGSDARLAVARSEEAI